MNMQGIREIARDRGFPPGRLRKIELIRSLQREEGYFDCYARAYAGYCDQTDCLWREDCLSLSARHGENG